MNSRFAVMTSFLVMVGLPGCSTFDCCHWWGRNTDGSSNLGKKPVPVQQGPIASTYTNPGVANTTAPVQQTIQPASAPVVTTSPAQSYSPTTTIEQSSPAITPPSPPSPLQNSAPLAPRTSMQLDDRTKSPAGGTFPPNQLTTAMITELPENKPSIPSPASPSPLVTGPTIPGSPRVDASPTPLLLATQSFPSSSASGAMPAQPTIAMPDIAAPTIAKPMEIAPPKVAVMGKSAGMNPGTTPPPLPPPPTPAVFDR